ncbi:MAG: hypothetical protein D6743_17255 [Calditrichaeota bacterium]|nr:MAG: hypothetical protein D6743_17255 [Calditrichota bacterium]
MKQAKLDTLLAQSKAADEFKTAVRNFVKGRESDLIEYNLGAPRVKILRVLMKLLETYPEEPITHVWIQGQSSCSGFVGRLVFGPNDREVEFNWDCLWKAKQEGLRTWYGAPDQTKAAQLYGYQCFARFQEVSNVAR